MKIELINALTCEASCISIPSIEFWIGNVNLVGRRSMIIKGRALTTSLHRSSALAGPQEGWDQSTVDMTAEVNDRRAS